jgi:hypothetical protein
MKVNDDFINFALNLVSKFPLKFEKFESFEISTVNRGGFAQGGVKLHRA